MSIQPANWVEVEMLYDGIHLPDLSNFSTTHPQKGEIFKVTPYGFKYLTEMTLTPKIKLAEAEPETVPDKPEPSEPDTVPETDKQKSDKTESEDKSDKTESEDKSDKTTKRKKRK